MARKPQAETKVEAKHEEFDVESASDKEIVEELDHELEEDLAAKPKQDQQVLEQDAQKQAATEATHTGSNKLQGDSQEVARPKLEGKAKLPKTTYEQPGTDNQARVDIGALEEQHERQVEAEERTQEANH